MSNNLKIQNSRLLLKRTKTALQIPTIPTLSTIHTDGTWNVEDIYPGELFLNMEDKKLYVGVENSLGVTDVVLLNPWTSGVGSCIDELYVTNIYGCSPVTIHDSIQNPTCSAPGYISTAFGQGTTASGESSFVIGIDCVASGHFSMAAGVSSASQGDYSAAFGASVSSGALSFSAGEGVVASGDSSAAFGRGTVADGDLSFAIGQYNNTGLSTGTFVIGNGTSLVSRSDFVRFDSVNSEIFMDLPAYADDTAAGTAGLTTGILYQTDGTGAAPLNVAGILMVKQ